MLYGLHNVLLQGHSQMQAVQQEIDSVKAEIQATKQELAAAEQAGDEAKVDFLRKEVSSLREQQTILLRAQAPGQHCSPCQNWLRPHTPVCAHHVRANFPHCAVPSP